jgi:hypothetical protein
LFAQNDRLNHWIVRTSYDYLFYLPQDDGKLLDPHKSIGGLSVELGARQYFFKDCGWFLEEAAEFYHLDYPVGKKGIRFKDSYWAWGVKNVRETGIGVSLSSGYDFRLRDNIDLGLFGGVTYRRSLKISEKELDGRKRNFTNLSKNNLKIKFGAELKINRYNISLSVSPDVFNRVPGRWIGGPRPKYKNIELALGVGYFF